jgi:radical SAM protein with 4Fe4S-binding SPASM domain
MVSIGTNGTLIDQGISQRLAEYQLKIQISLDGATPETHDKLRGKGAFSQAIKGLDLLLSQDLGKDIVIAFTTTKLNMEEIPDIIQFGLERSIPVIQFPPLSPSGRAKANWDDLKLSSEETLDFWTIVAEKAEELKGRMDLLADCFSMNISRSGIKSRCSIGTQIRVDPAGYIYPCQCFHAGQKYCLGNIRKSNFEEIAAGQKLRNVKQECFERTNLIEECRECPWKNFCGSGCMGSAYETTGTSLSPNECETRKQWIQGLFKKELGKIVSP